MMKFTLLALWAVSFMATAQELIKIQTPYTSTHSGTPAMIKIIEEANSIQRNYTFLLEFRPGANQTLAVREMDNHPNSQLAIIAASYVENVDSGAFQEGNYVPVYSLGDACWVVITNTGGNTVKSLSGAKELVVGTVGFGNATHLTALQIAKKHNLKVMLVPFKSNFDAVVNMAGNQGVTFGIDRVQAYESLKIKNTKLSAVASSCSKRIPQLPNLKTLAEQGIEAPSVFNIVVANKNMPQEKRDQLGKILDRATKNIGESAIQEISGFVPAVYIGMTAQEHFNSRTKLVKKLRDQYRKEISQDK
jgi:tripartite-type tricarboxylate transporter receptor subunit TctC